MGAVEAQALELIVGIILTICSSLHLLLFALGSALSSSQTYMYAESLFGAESPAPRSRPPFFRIADPFSAHSGANVKVMRKAKLSVHKSDVQSIIRAFSIEVPANSLDDLAEVSFGDFGRVLRELRAYLLNSNRTLSSFACGRLEERATTRHSRRSRRSARLLFSVSHQKLHGSKFKESELVVLHLRMSDLASDESIASSPKPQAALSMVFNIQGDR